MRFSAVALAGFAGTSLLCGDCDVRWIVPARAQAQDAGKESQAAPANDAEPGYWESLFATTMRFTIMHPAGKHAVDVFYNRDKTVSTNVGHKGVWHTEGAAGRKLFCYQIGEVAAEPKTISECFPLRLMNNPRIGAKWGGKMKPDVSYLAEVVASRATQPLVQ